MTPAELFEALRPWAHRIADTQRALLNDRNRPDQALDQPGPQPPRWHDPAHHAARHWAQACRAYLIHDHPTLADTAWHPTMTWPTDFERLCDTPHNRPDGLTQQVLDGALHRAGLRHTSDGRLAAAHGAQLKCAQPGCVGVIDIGSARCKQCNASFKTALVYRCQHDDCDHILDQNQIETGLCATHRNHQRNAEPADHGCVGGRRHQWLDGGTELVCNRCKRTTTPQEINL